MKRLSIYLKTALIGALLLAGCGPRVFEISVSKQVTSPEVPKVPKVNEEVADTSTASDPSSQAQVSSDTQESTETTAAPPSSSPPPAIETSHASYYLGSTLIGDQSLIDSSLALRVEMQGGFQTEVEIHGNAKKRIRIFNGTAPYAFHIDTPGPEIQPWGTLSFFGTGVANETDFQPRSKGVFQITVTDQNGLKGRFTVEVLDSRDLQRSCNFEIIDADHPSNVKSYLFHGERTFRYVNSRTSTTEETSGCGAGRMFGCYSYKIRAKAPTSPDGQVCKVSVNGLEINNFESCVGTCKSKGSTTLKNLGGGVYEWSSTQYLQAITLGY